MTQQDWSDFYLVHGDLTLATDHEVDAVEAVLSVQLPGGYRELVTTLGAGEIGGILRVYPPRDLEGEQEIYRELVQEAWFFEEPDEALTVEYALQSVSIADSLDGDQLIFHPGSGRLHVLPRHDVRTYFVGTGVRDAVAWFQESGVLTRPHPFRYFEPLAGPTEAVNGSGRDGDLSELRDAVGSLGLHDAVETAGDDCTFFVRAIGGYLGFHRTDSGDVNVHFRYRSDLAPDVRARVRETAVAAGVTFGQPWSMSSAPSD